METFEYYTVINSCFDVLLRFHTFWNLIYNFYVFTFLIKFRPDIQSMNSYVLCSFIPSFIRKGTNLKCDIEKEKMAILYRGSKVAATECRYQFRMRPWNCSAAFESEPRIIYHRKSFKMFSVSIFKRKIYRMRWTVLYDKILFTIDQNLSCLSHT